MSDFLSFKLPDDFIVEYEGLRPDWGFDIGGGNSLSELTFISKYSRLKEDGSKERWHEVCRRCVEGMYSILKDHTRYQRTPWNDFKAMQSAKDAYHRMFHFKWMPPGRGLQHMGTRWVHENKNSSPLQNCAALSTAKLSAHSYWEAVKPFVLLAEMSMNGVGVGFTTDGAGRITLCEPTEKMETFVVPDTREGWAESIGKLLESYFFKNRPTVLFDYSEVRPAGAPLKTFGGVAGGAGPLINCHESIAKQLSGRTGQRITSRDIVDIMNKIGKAVVSAGSRRSAELSLGDPDDIDYVSLKDWTLPENAERTGSNGWSWLSNSSVVAEVGKSYPEIVEKIKINGEPGFVWMDTCHKYGRLIDPINHLDDRAIGVNPCSEQILFDAECCTLVETFVTRHETFEDYRTTLKAAYLYGKAVTLLPTSWPESNEVMARNRRIGCSMSGLAQFVEERGWAELKTWMDEGYNFIVHRDKKYSEWLAVRESIKKTSIKPSGTTSILASVTPGVHWPTTSGTYIRRVRYQKDDPLVKTLKAAGYKTEPAEGDITNTVVVEFPTRGINTRSEREVSLWEKAELAIMAQRYWSDNSVSSTITFMPDEADQIPALLASKDGQFKSVSFLPIDEDGTTYAQAPYEPLDQVLAEKMLRKIKPLDMESLYSSGVEAEGDKYCATDVCEVKF